jgi:DNA-directed RNA polymerase specialized sigma24 family protein
LSEPFFVPVNPHALAACTAAPELEELEQARAAIADHDAEQLREMLALLPPLETALVLADLEGRSHRRLALQLGVSRQAVTKRVQRALVRLAWLAQWPGLSIPRDEVRVVCRRHLHNPFRRTVLAYWPQRGRQLPTQAELGGRYGIGQDAVQKRLVRASEQLNARAELDPDAAGVAHALVMLITSPSILRYEAQRDPRRALQRLSRLSTEG